MEYEVFLGFWGFQIHKFSLQSSGYQLLLAVGYLTLVRFLFFLKNSRIVRYLAPILRWWISSSFLLYQLQWTHLGYLRKRNKLFQGYLGWLSYIWNRGDHFRFVQPDKAIQFFRMSNLLGYSVSIKISLQFCNGLSKLTFFLFNLLGALPHARARVEMNIKAHFPNLPS